MFKSFFKKKVSNELKKPSPIDDNVFTIVCVLVEAALVDNNFGNDEKSVIIKILQKQYKIKNIKEINDVLDNAIEACKESSDLITYTKK